jgi:hypothetical protein
MFHQIIGPQDDVTFAPWGQIIFHSIAERHSLTLESYHPLAKACPISEVVSMGRCNTGSKLIWRSLKGQIRSPVSIQRTTPS